MQIFPLNLSSLPATHPTDKEVFGKFWQGDKSISFEQFKKDDKTF